tara:strand:- start:110 stop:451 length:342 start_codon:yes stop_codon:yes gene_type:complete
MSKIRLIPLNKEDKDVFEVYMPGKNGDYPIGRIWLDIHRNEWLLKTYFVPLTRDELKKDRFYKDSMHAARMLKDMFERVDWEFESDFNGSVEDTDPMYQLALFDLDNQNTGSD